MSNVVVTGCPRADFGEVGTLTALRHGELGLDRYGLRAVPAQLGVEYVDYQSYQEAPQ
jgi:hypothetical protein